MFGYVFPCKMELKIKDYEKFKAYYCGLCISLKNNFGEIYRLCLNYDMTFLAILLDGLKNDKRNFVQKNCIMHPLKKRLFILDNHCIDHAAYCNILLTYHKMLDNVEDDNNFNSKIFSSFLKKHLNNSDLYNLDNIKIKNYLNNLSIIEKNYNNESIDEVCEPFANLTGYILSCYYKNEDFSDNLFWVGYYLGKWIYLIDAFDDLEKDIKHNKFNAINVCFNKDNKSFINFKNEIKNKIDFLLTFCASQCLDYLNKIPLKRNKNLIYNILQFGLMEKMDIIFKRRDLNYE